MISTAGSVAHTVASAKVNPRIPNLKPIWQNEAKMINHFNSHFPMLRLTNET
jgi:hypothetical protein